MPKTYHHKSMMKKSRLLSKIIGWTLRIILYLIVLVFVMVIAIYLPPVQHWAKGKLCDYLSEQTGLNVSIGQLSLTFPLDLVAEDMLALQPYGTVITDSLREVAGQDTVGAGKDTVGAGQDTVVAAKQLQLDVRLLPLLEGRIELNGFELRGAVVNTMSLISDTRIEGRMRLLAIRRPAVCDLKKKDVDISRLRLKDADVRVFLSDTAAVDTTPSAPVEWKIRVGNTKMERTKFYVQMPHDSMRVGGNILMMRAQDVGVDLKNSAYSVGGLNLAAQDVSYDLPYMKKQDGFDSNHIHLSVLDTRLANLRYDDKGLDLRLHHLDLREQCGIAIDKLAGNIHYDSTRVRVGGLTLQTPYSSLRADADIPFAALEGHNKDIIHAKVSGELGKQDVIPFLSKDVASMLEALPNKPIQTNLRMEGTMGNLTVDYCRLILPGQIEVRMSGKMRSVLSDLHRSGRLHYDMAFQHADALRALIPADLRGTIQIPDGLRIGGNIILQGQAYGLNKNTIYLDGGSLRFTGTFNASAMAYKGQIQSHTFPLQKILPQMGLSPLTADIDVDGRGTDFLNRGTHLKANARIQAFAFQDIPLDSVVLTADVRDANANASIDAHNRWLNGQIQLQAQKKGTEIDGSIQGSIFDLCLGLGTPPKDSTDIMAQTHLMANLDLKGFYDEKGKMAVGGNIGQLNVFTSEIGYPCGDVAFMLGTSADSTHIGLTAGDMRLMARSAGPFDKITDGLSRFADGFITNLMAAQLNQDTLKALLPDLHIRLQAGKINPLRQFMAYKGYDFDSIYGRIATTPQQGADAEIHLTNFHTGAVLLEQSQLDIYQDTAGIKLRASVINTSKKNPNRFTARVDGSVLKDGFQVLAHFADEKGKVGLNIGTRATLDGHGGTSFTLIPEVSTLAYRQFKVNKDNFLAIDSAGYFSADINLLADDKTHIMLFSAKDDSLNQDITLSLANVNLHDLSSVLPYVPQLGGTLGGDIHVQRTDTTVTAVGQLQTRNLEYEGLSIGDIGTELFYMPDQGGQYVVADILMGEAQVASLEGHYWDKGDGLLDATATLEKFPVALLNTFITTDGTLALRGMANGEIKVEGPTSALVLNGKLTPDSIHAYSELYGFDLRMEDKDIKIEKSRILLDDVRFYSIGDNPLRINGDVDLSDLGNMQIDLSLKAKDYQLVKAEKTKKTVLYGNVYVDLDATLKSHREFMVLGGQLKVLGNTDFTYIMRDTPLQVDDQFSGLVEFVDFSATEDEQPEEEVATGGLVVNLALNIDEQTHLHCLLSEDGKSYVDCNGGGNLQFRMFPSGDMSMQGRYNILSGEMKYTLPFIPLKTFKFTQGNYILFNGDVSNPTLNITAMESVKASVTDDSGASRMVKFNVGVAITRTLSNMGIEFLIEAPEDSEVQNEIATMSSENKSRLAVSMLATGLYLSSTNKTGFKANNALNAFLESEIQNIAGSALKTIDISAGVEGNTTATGETQTDYTFQFSKKLWGDRVTFVIGGKVTTGASDDNSSSSQSFIDNVSLEYRLDKGGTRYVQLFYDNDTHDPLEGSYSTAGAGYILRRKVDSLSELLLWRKQKKQDKNEP